jgi:F420H(2)-dependent quinone reductase
MAKLGMRAASAVHSGLYRLSGGRLGGRMAGAPVLLLTTTGRKSGKARTVPLLYTRDGDTYTVIASMGGAPQHPAWYTNLQANPSAEVAVGRDAVAVTARDAEGEERQRLWSSMTELYPAYDDYQKKTERRIPVVVLEPRS